MAGEEVYVKQVVVMPSGIDLAEPTDEPERVWGKYGSSPLNEKGNSNNLVQETSTQPDNVKVVDSCEQCRLPCQKVCCVLLFSHYHLNSVPIR